MYSVLFVDDDPLVIKRLNSCIDWNALNFKILPHAADGEQAVLYVEKYCPDIIITDINMPVMDGLTLIEKLHKTNCTAFIIVLTVTDSFGCAQQALNLGVDNYILKPIESDKIYLVVNKIVSKLENQCRADNYLSELEAKAELNDKFFKDKILNMAISGRQILSESQLQKEFEFYNILPNAVQFQIVTLYFDFSTVTQKSHLENLISAITSSIENCLYEYISCSIFIDFDYHINLLLGFRQNPSLMQQDIPTLCKVVNECLQRELGLQAIFFVSQRRSFVRYLYQSYNETKYLLDVHEGFAEKTCILYEEFCQSQLYNAFEWDNFRNTLFSYLRMGKIEQISTFVQNTLQTVSTNQKLFYLVKIDFVTNGLIFMQESKLNTAEIFNEDYDPLFEIRSMNTVVACYNLIKDFLLKILQTIKAHKIPSSQRLVENCVRLIEENLHTSTLSLVWLAEKLYVNSSYLSTQFTKTMHTPISKYVLEQRLLKGKCFLESNYSNVQVVAEKVGFSDPLYFSKCFKKRYGIPPSHIINQNN